MEETKQKRFEIRLSDEEKQNIEEKAKLKKVGTNINQIAHKLNSNGLRFGSCLFRVSVDCSQTMSICIRMRCSIIVISCSVSFVHVDSRP